jgi:hypothetical protein
MTEDQLTATTRREILKKVGIGAAVAWSAPAVLSVDAAFAGGSPRCPADGCQKDGQCAAAATCGPTGDCACFFTTEPGDQTACTNGEFSCSGQQVCQTCDDCPSGWSCVRTCCPDPVCRPPCGTPAGAGAGAEGGARSSL